MRHIEFVGIPGSGKTTLAHALKAQIRAVGINACDLNQISINGYASYSSRSIVQRFKAWLKSPVSTWRQRRHRRRCCYNDRFVAWLEFFDAHPDIVQRVAAEVTTMAPDAVGLRRAYRELLHMYANYQAAKVALGECDVLVLDEGFCHRRFSAAAARNELADAQRFAQSLRAGLTPNVLVWVQVHPSLAEERMRARGRCCRSVAALDRAERTVRIEQWDECIRAFIAELDEPKKQMHVVCIENDKSPAEVAGSLNDVASLVTGPSES